MVVINSWKNGLRKREREREWQVCSSVQRKPLWLCLFAFCRSNHLPGQRNWFPRGRVQVNRVCFVSICAAIILSDALCVFLCLCLSVNTVLLAAWRRRVRFLELFQTVTERWVPAEQLHTFRGLVLSRWSLFAYWGGYGSVRMLHISPFLKLCGMWVLFWWPHSPPAAPELMGAESPADDLMLGALSELRKGEMDRKREREGGVLLADGEDREERRGVLQGARCPTGTEEGQGQRVKGRWDNSLAENNKPLIQSSCRRVLLCSELSWAELRQRTGVGVELLRRLRNISCVWCLAVDVNHPYMCLKSSRAWNHSKPLTGYLWVSPAHVTRRDNKMSCFTKILIKESRVSVLDFYQCLRDSTFAE